MKLHKKTTIGLFPLFLLQTLFGQITQKAKPLASDSVTIDHI